MKRIEAMRSACLAAATLVAAGSLVYGLAFVAFPQVKPAGHYHIPGYLPIRCAPPAQDVSVIWTQALGDVTEHPPKHRFEATLVGTTTSARPSNTFAVVNSAAGQFLVRPGDRFQDAVLATVTPGTATFSYGGASTQLKITRSEK